MNLKPWYNFLLYSFVILFTINFIIMNLTSILNMLKGDEAILDFATPLFTALFTALAFLIVFRNRDVK